MRILAFVVAIAAFPAWSNAPERSPVPPLRAPAALQASALPGAEEQADQETTVARAADVTTPAPASHHEALAPSSGTRAAGPLRPTEDRPLASLLPLQPSQAPYASLGAKRADVAAASAFGALSESALNTGVVPEDRLGPKSAVTAQAPGPETPRPRFRLPVADVAVTMSSANAMSPFRPSPREADALQGVQPSAFSTAKPRLRPDGLERPRNPARETRVVQVSSALAVSRSIRPPLRPENLRRRSVVQASGLVPTQPDPRAITGRKGSVCGDRSIRGQTVAPIAGRLNGCGVSQPVRVTEVDGVLLSTPATIDCTTALALRRWVSETVKPSVGRLGGGVRSLQVFAHYACRTRNNQKGAKISEHGRGRAIDIGAINLANGSSITVLHGWRDPDLGQLLRRMHRGACGPFGTVLGPDADRFHQNHFHFDTARYRSGAYCR